MKTNLSTILSFVVLFMITTFTANAQLACLQPVLDTDTDKVKSPKGTNVVTLTDGACATEPVEVVTVEEVPEEKPAEIVYVYVYEPVEISDVSAREKIDAATKAVFFDFDEAIIKRRGYRILDDVAVAMQSTEKFNLVIEGHADKVGTKAYNKDLGLDRAKAVHDYLVRKGVDDKRLFIRSYGENDPISEDPKYNRRVEFFIAK